MASLSVRPIGIRDLSSLRQLAEVYVPLGHDAAYPGSISAEVLAALPLGRRYWRAFVATVDDDIRALVEVQPEPDEFRWVVTRLTAAGQDAGDGASACAAVWSELMLYAIRAAGVAGAKRLHAVSPLAGPAFEALRRAGFSVYAYQTSLLAQGLHPGQTGTVPLREQEPSDAWSIHHLYHLATPRPVQYAEAFTSNHWDAGRRAGSRIRGFLVEREHEVAAYCRITSRGHRHVMDVLTLPGEAAILDDLVPAALARVVTGERDTVWVSIPDYHSEYVAHLERLGFQPDGRQARMVRYTAVPVQTRIERSLSLVPEVGERLSVRLPSYSAAKRRGGRVWPGTSVL